jgi:hypothetical protein
MHDTPPSSLRDPNVGPRTKQWKEQIFGAHFLTRNTLGVRVHARASG